MVDFRWATAEACSAKRRMNLHLGRAWSWQQIISQTFPRTAFYRLLTRIQWNSGTRFDTLNSNEFNRLRWFEMIDVPLCRSRCRKKHVLKMRILRAVSSLMVARRGQDSFPGVSVTPLLLHQLSISTSLCSLENINLESSLWTYDLDRWSI